VILLPETLKSQKAWKKCALYGTFFLLAEYAIALDDDAAA
jgi:hypothetical protein